ncbi:YheC/YheD family protein [Paenibacillus sp. NPDC058071]|uniref:YheC/YheD family endospore coat-associated protein n=1 Tax=Paenibacillus sp. NPDC058071 TaxID=3346326 RepID=UPI0036DC096F
MNYKNGLVGILVANRIQRKNVLKQYLQHNAAAKMKVICFTPSSINWKTKSVIGLHFSKGRWVPGKFPFPHVVYNRCYDTNKEIIKRLGAVIGKDKCFNHINRFSKIEIYNRLSDLLVDYLPETVAYEKEKAVQMLKDHKILYLKPCYGNKGKGVYRVELKESGEIHICHHYFSPKIIARDSSQFQNYIQKLIGTTPYIIQEGVEALQINEQNFDIRALVQKNEKGLWKVTNIISRIAYEGSYNTSICEKVCLSIDIFNHLYPQDTVEAILCSIDDISLKAAEILDSNTSYHLGEFSVDFTLDNNEQIWIIELNGQPQKSLYSELLNQNEVYKRPLQYARYLCTH